MKNLAAPFLPKLCIIAAILFTLSSCSTLQDISNNVQKPSVSVQDVRVTNFNFQEIELTYDIKMNNPNAVSVQMLGYNYRLDTNGNTLVSGQQNKKLTINGSGQSSFSIPTTVRFDDLYGAIQAYRSKDETAYQFSSNLIFDLPVLGKTELPIEKNGTIPVLRMPDIRLLDWSVESLSFSGTDVSVQLAFDNPNTFGIDINQLDYELMINGNKWADGTALQNSSISDDGRTVLEIPLSLSFKDIGMSAYRILRGSEPFDYRIRGTFDVTLLHEMLGQTTFDFDREGRLSLSGNN